MSRVCKITGKRPMAGNNVSKAHNKTRRVQRPNLQRKRIYLPEEGRTVTLRLSARALRTVDRKGLMNYLRDEGLELRDVT
ncbi:MAG: 50S ribosomal protein L28 [Spirochaetaceae bacterium]|nr:50S ribosomal protein L28 [Spirochaetaceae bacterium]MDE0228859.1 50S ribosomal protein L28 [Spirochaetaceae bacterium]MDE0447750.1 50S ribosomal protein L28 [Spirochaetaceae bacterium]